MLGNTVFFEGFRSGLASFWLSHSLSVCGYFKTVQRLLHCQYDKVYAKKHQRTGREMARKRQRISREIVEDKQSNSKEKVKKCPSKSRRSVRE